jgi:hypothetical protein
MKTIFLTLNVEIPCNKVRAVKYSGRNQRWTSKTLCRAQCKTGIYDTHKHRKLKRTKEKQLLSEVKKPRRYAPCQT